MADVDPHSSPELHQFLEALTQIVSDDDLLDSLTLPNFADAAITRDDVSILERSAGDDSASANQAVCKQDAVDLWGVDPEPDVDRCAGVGNVDESFELEELALERASTLDCADGYLDYDQVDHHTAGEEASLVEQQAVDDVTADLRNLRADEQVVTAVVHEEATEGAAASRCQMPKIRAHQHSRSLPEQKTLRCTSFDDVIERQDAEGQGQFSCNENETSESLSSASPFLTPKSRSLSEKRRLFTKSASEGASARLQTTRGGASWMSSSWLALKRGRRLFSRNLGI